MSPMEAAEELLDAEKQKNRGPMWLSGAAMQLLPGLVAECKRQQERAEKAEGAAQEMWNAQHTLEAEAARWQVVAQEERKQTIMATFARPPGWSDEQVEKECSGRAAASLGQPKAWLIDEKRELAIERAAELLEVLLEEPRGNEKNGYVEDLPVLRAMLTEAKQE